MERSTRSTPDPRTIITPEAFSVAPQLLGLPTAPPWRRAAAMAVDLLLVALLVNAGGVFLGLVLAAALVRAAWRAPSAGRGRRWLRAGLGVVAGLVLFVTAVTGWEAIQNRIAGESEGARATFSGSEAGALTREMIDFRRASTEAEARAAAARVAERLRGEGMPEGEVAEILLGVTETGMPQWAPAAVRAVLDSMAPRTEPRPDRDSVVAAYARLLEPGDSAAIAAMRPRLFDAVAGDSVAELQQRIGLLASRTSHLSEQLQDAEQGPSLLGIVRTFADDLGLGFGWAGLYFTLALSIWRGRTPGKRLFGIRVLRLDGEPMTWWVALGRFGGYAAGVATGLLGFAQVFWDRNRQAIHDKIAETVVVRG